MGFFDVSTLTRRLLTLLVVASPLWVASAAHAQVFSPGELASPHRGLEGLSNCLKCHTSGEKLSNDLCLKCHTHIKRRVAKRSGYHGRLKGQTCYSCHSEHKGRKHELIKWPLGSKTRFPHERTGWDLKGAHGKLDCKECHQPRRVTERAVKRLQKSRKGTFLGLPTTCVSCHFDEHRGQLKNNCSKCHSESGNKGFASTPGFRHNRDTHFKRTGKHRRVACRKCHEAKKDTTTPADAFPAPKSDMFAQYKPIAHRTCLSCHEDHHEGAMGNNCTRCHSTDGWEKLKGSVANTGFHDKTAFPLSGAHRSVACELCHGPFKGQKEPVYKPVPHERCVDCHRDSHVGQLEREGRPTPDCATCHVVDRFSPTRFSVEDHASARYALEGAHLAAACNGCHPRSDDLKDKVAADELGWLNKRGRELLVSPFVIKRDDVTGACAECHEDAHDGQLTAADEGGAIKACETCHQVSDFADITFDHDTDSQFPLTGKHKGADCRACHHADDEAGRGPVRYKPLEQDCAACHDDRHVGQLKRENEEHTDCARCHATEGFTPTSGFDHNDPMDAAFPLRGMHGELDCVRCHQKVQAADAEVVWYKGVPQGCRQCHVDEHDRRFDRFAPSEVKVAEGEGAPCDACHRETGWLPASGFDHSGTGFILEGEHARANCKSCHAQGYARAPATSCNSCHTDPHGQELGQFCQGCHDATSWASRYDALAHRMSNFPLSGRHALLPCQECHRNRRDQGFTRKAVDCQTCHRSAYDNAMFTTVDHLRSGFSEDCKRCHQPTTFTPAAFPQHDSCFSLSAGPHRVVGCQECHKSTSGLVADGSCRTENTGCVRCHAHTQELMAPIHTDVPAYGWASERCVGCHTR